VLCTLDDGAEIRMEFTVATGKGYVPAERNRPEDAPDVAGGDEARAGLAQGHALGRVARRADRDRLDVEVQILNPDLVLCTLDDGAEIRMEFTVATGKGYVPAERSLSLSRSWPSRVFSMR
jgi:DNA-directed RNA polymerase alpha subunit